MDPFLAGLGEEVQDADEETFDVFSQSFPSRDLGMVDPKASSLALEIAGRDFEIAQSPGVLQSSRGGGTTGAAVWHTSLRFAEWLAWSKNPLFQHQVVSSRSAVLELGSGVSGIVPSVLSTQVQRVVATDQLYILKTLRENIDANARQQASQRKKTPKLGRNTNHQHNVDVLALDWENDDIPSLMALNGLMSGVDLVVACDCVYNYALIAPFVQTCADICAVRNSKDEEVSHPTICVIAQQLRQPDVFQQWLEAFHQVFRVWRLPSELLTEDLRDGSGFIMHLAILRG